MVETIWWDNRTHSLYPSRKLQLLTLLLYFINTILEIWESNVFTFFLFPLLEIKRYYSYQHAVLHE